jgi:hypothetical protein
MPSLQQVLAGQRVTASMLRGAAGMSVIKSEDQTVTSSTTFVEDEELFLALPASTSWTWGAYLIFEGASGGGHLALKWDGPGTILYGATYVRASDGGTVVGGSYGGGVTVTAQTLGSGSLRAFMLRGTVVAGVAGTLQLSWAQGTSNATGTIVHAGSSLEAVQSS